MASDDPSRTRTSGAHPATSRADEPTFTASEWRLRALSPLDGRYGAQMEPYAATFSEGALIRERFAVEVAWLEHLAALPELTELPPLSDHDREALERWVERFGQAEAAAVKRIEAVTNHDVKAVEYYLKRRLVEDLGWPGARTEFVHFAATSEDVNNLAYAPDGAGRPGGGLAARRIRTSGDSARALRWTTPGYRCSHARTASQPRPRRLAKSWLFSCTRWERQLRAVRSVEVPGKWGGATGTLAAHVATYPELDWMAIAGDFVASMGFTWSPLTTQVEPHDWMAELFAAMSRFGTVLIDFCQDMWFYISLGYFRQRVLANEVGSSVMPHKVNPIDFENAEANAGMAGAMFGSPLCRSCLCPECSGIFPILPRCVILAARLAILRLRWLRHGAGWHVPHPMPRLLQPTSTAPGKYWRRPFRRLCAATACPNPMSVSRH